MQTANDLYNRCLRGENIPTNELLEITEQWKARETKLFNLEVEVSKLRNKSTLLGKLLGDAVKIAESGRSIDEIRGALEEEHAAPLFNAYEMRSILHALDEKEQVLLQKDKINRELAAERPALTPEQMLEAIEEDIIIRFTFVEVRQLVEHLKVNPGRPIRRNLKGIKDLIKSKRHAVFHKEEMLLLKQWGEQCERDTARVKGLLGRIFLIPAAYADPNFDTVLKPEVKKSMLQSGMPQSSFQQSLYPRLEAFSFPSTWKVCDGKTQFHAGDHFHTRTDTGLWWCGRTLNELPTHQLVHILEQTLADLRLLRLQYPEGIHP